MLPTSSEIAYRYGSLYCEDVALADIAAAVGTPVYVYSAGLMQRRYAEFAGAVDRLGGRVCYAVKANSNQAVIALFARQGAGADVVSEGELRRALAAGVPPDRIVFSGVAKTARELTFAIEQGVGQVNVESETELELLSKLAAERGARVRIAIRINPDVDAGTHPKITTGKAENKFGINIDRAPALYARAARMPGIEPSAVAVHIGSQILDMTPLEGAFTRVAELVRELRSAGIAISHLDLGGGIGVPYRGETPADLDEYAAIIARTVGPLDCSLTFEPGRFLVAEAGLLVTQIVALKQGLGRLLVVQDGAMNDLIRPTLYEAFHPVYPIRDAGSAARREVDVVGPVCESGDYLAPGIDLPPVEEGELLAIGFAGAYGASMSSTYNTRPLVPEVLVQGMQWDVVRPRQSYEALIGQDRVPAWVGG